MADLVKARMVKWAEGEGRDQLWQDATKRSSKVQSEGPKKGDQGRLESHVLSAALRLGDVRKALQMLNSAPIAAKTKDTLDRMRKLHPQGEDPEPGPSRPLARFEVNVVRKALSTFGPSSAAGLFGYKPFLLQQCMRAESFYFPNALTSAVNEFLLQGERLHS